MREKKKIIAVIGGRDCDESLCQQAFEVGRLIARNGAILVCGGRGGIMEAACKGASEAGGISVGILPGDDIRDANSWVTVPIATGVGLARNSIIARTASAAIAIGGEYGTLSEIAYCLQFRIPVFTLHSWDIKGVVAVDTPEEAVKFACDSEKYTAKAKGNNED
ncbi:MAG: TIGR00725 family protein [Candidatus Marinimicrobia bacterium]|nr:TIGR00725 family protein [bacterium]MCG2714672.1 TIGR00725 family protein [Candidatus Neomarinimicrobiota bacterium]